MKNKPIWLFGGFLPTILATLGMLCGFGFCYMISILSISQIPINYLISHKILTLILNDRRFQPISIHDLPSPRTDRPWELSSFTQEEAIKLLMEVEIWLLGREGMKHGCMADVPISLWILLAKNGLRWFNQPQNWISQDFTKPEKASNIIQLCNSNIGFNMFQAGFNMIGASIKNRNSIEGIIAYWSIERGTCWHTCSVCFSTCTHTLDIIPQIKMPMKSDRFHSKSVLSAPTIVPWRQPLAKALQAQRHRVQLGPGRLRPRAQCRNGTGAVEANGSAAGGRHVDGDAAWYYCTCHEKWRVSSQSWWYTRYIIHI